MRHLPAFTIAVCTAALYLGAIAVGLRVKPSDLYSIYAPAPRPRTWHIESLGRLSPEKLSTVAYGARLFTETPLYASAYTSSRITCGNCHLQGGTAPFTAPVIGSAQAYPKYSARAKRSVTLEDRVQECMTRSENGRPLPHDSPEMHALLTYIQWLSEPHPTQAKFDGRGLEHLPTLTPDPTHGAEIYAAQCAGCHGANGEGTRRPFPPLWGPQAFNDGAGMNTVEKMAAFVHVAMPQNRKGILSPQDAFDVAAFIHQQPRPAFNHAYDRF
jgi:thiosulfate dehydrogenase